VSMQTAGGPTATTFSGNDTLWVSSEFGGELAGSGPNAFYENAYTPSPQPVSTSTVTPFEDSYNVANNPFAMCIYSCSTSAASELAEASTYADGMVWSTEGGGELYSGSIPNASEILGLDPANGSICTYLVPGNNVEVVGITATGTGAGTRIWFVAQDPIDGHPLVESFEPSEVGDACPGTYPLSGATSLESFPIPNKWPNQIAADPSGTLLWITDTVGNDIESVNTVTGATISYPYAPTNAYDTFAGAPIAYSWDVVADANYVYAIDYGDANLIQIEKNGPDPGQVNVVPLPLTNDEANGFGLALEGSELYFTTTEGGNFGVIDTGSWEAASQACAAGVDCAPAPLSGTEYTGLLSAVGAVGGSLEGIAVSPSGQLSITDYDNKSVIRLVP
jgi:hypothetical protein